MDRIGSDESSVEGAGGNVEARWRTTWPRTLLAATLPPLGALSAQLLVGMASARWSLFYPAIFISAWLGGFRSGVGATVLSSALVWWYVILPSRYLHAHLARQGVLTAVFALMGILVSVLQERLRRASRNSAAALHATQRTNEQLQKVLKERGAFAALIANSSDFIGMTDTVGRAWYLNPAGRRMIGFPSDGVVEGTRVTEFYPSELRAFMSDVVMQETLEHGQWHGETRLRHWRTGEAIPVSLTAFLIRDVETSQVIGIGTITRDISGIQRNREQLEAANRRLAETSHDLEENQRFLEAILKYSPNGIVIKDLNGRYVKVNPRLERLLELPAAQIHGKEDFDVFPREMAERFRANDRVVIETREPLTTEERATLPDGEHVFLVTKFPLFEGGDDERVFAICAIWSDITRRKRTEDALRQSEGDLREAQRVAHVGSWSWDPRTDAPRLSEELYRIFGRDPAIPLPKLFTEQSDVFTPESLAALRVGIGQVMSKGEPYQLELEVVRPDGSHRWIAASGDAVRDATGRVVEITGTAQDVTELKKLQQMREEWTSVIAHDLRQPIGVIAAAADFLPTLHIGEMNSQERDFGERIRAAARTLARMVDDLLDLSLLEADRLKLERAWIDPGALVREAVERLRHLTGEGRVRVPHSGRVGRVFVDPMRIDQVLGNLISNAVKYGDADSEIIVRLARRDHELDISVTNHGKGIAPDELPRVFTRFMRTKAARGSGQPGLGVGLYIAKGLIEAHGGRMWVESTPGETTTFHLTLPCTAAAQEAA